uniref:Uncharacterized protein n=1 Tax=Brassica oleracea TaxID=3712 RepID=A0A3P6F4X0_BRAOL|nr:unnamed protein product [Brassica oleracea]
MQKNVASSKKTPHGGQFRRSQRQRSQGTAKRGVTSRVICLMRASHARLEFSRV